jgi:RNA polymerase sigma factor (sigma-70 family)
MDPTSDTELEAPSPDVVARLVESHREFLRFLEARVASRAVAEELLQNAFVRTLEKGSSIREDENAVAWFYRLLRNALSDHYRRNATEKRALEREASQTEGAVELELRGAVCECMKTLLPALKAEYAQMLERVDLAERDLPSVAAELGITPNNAAVRLHRARQALKRALERSCGTCAAHGCLDCNCGNKTCV